MASRTAPRQVARTSCGAGMFDVMALTKRRYGLILPRQLARQGVDLVLTLCRV